MDQAYLRRAVDSAERTGCDLRLIRDDIETPPSQVRVPNDGTAPGHLSEGVPGIAAGINVLLIAVVTSICQAADPQLPPQLLSLI